MKKLIALAIATITLACTATTVTATEVKLYDSKDLTLEILQNRVENNDIIIETVIGVCLDEEGNGMILNPIDEDHTYIAYDNDVCKGDTVLSIFIYNPDTSWDDDVIERCDFIIDR